MPLVIREENYPTPQTSCHYGFTVHDGYVHCKPPDNIFLDCAIGTLIFTLIICGIYFVIRLIANSKYGSRVFPPLPINLAEQLFSIRSNTQPTNTAMVYTNENGESILDDSADPETVPKYTTNVDSNYDLGFYDKAGEFVVVPKPQPSYLTTFPNNSESYLSSSPQFSKDPPAYFLHPPQYSGTTLVP